MASSDKHFELAVGISVEALKALLFVNAGAAGALIALTGKAPTEHDYSFAVLTFGAAAIFTAVAMVVGYLSQLSYANQVAEAEKNDVVAASREHTRHTRANVTALVLVVIVLMFSIAGMASAFIAARS